MIDRVRYPDGFSYSEADLIDVVGIDGSAHAVLRLDNGKYRAISLLQIVRLVNPIAPADAPADAPAA